MSEYIKRQQVIDCLFANCDETASAIVADVEAIPTANVRLVVPGRWIPYGKDNQSCQCSNCRNVFDNSFRFFNGCPICFSDMRNQEGDTP